ncbi:hypothetical protein Tco_1022728 [Tanacetum coccineum]
MDPLKADEELVIQPAEVTAHSRESPKHELFVVYPGSVATWIKDRKCKTRGGSSRPLVKRKLAPRSSISHVKTSSSKDDVPYLTVSDDDEGLPDVLELKDATACHLKIFVITPPSWKNHLDNHMDAELLDLHDRCYARQAVVDNCSLIRRSLPRELLQTSFVLLVSLVITLTRWDYGLEAVVSMAIAKNFSPPGAVGLSSTVLLSEMLEAPAPIEALLSKKPPSLQRPAPSRTQVSLPSS